MLRRLRDLLLAICLTCILVVIAADFLRPALPLVIAVTLAAFALELALGGRSRT